MSEKYKIRERTWPYFVTFTVIKWIDVFTRDIYRNIVVDSINHCITHKGLVVHAWVIMTNHVHMVIDSRDQPLEHIIRDMKRHTSKKIVESVIDNIQESRDWMVRFFERAGQRNSMNENFQFWQNGYHPLHCWKVELIRQKIRYTHENPVRAGFCNEAHHWKYSSAEHYSTGMGLVAIEPLDIL